jgi:CDP-glucose 4,6-dehydratase
LENLNKLREFWKNKKVFITGHTGFKGSWLIIFLNMLGARIYGYSLKPNTNSLFNQIKGDINIKENIFNDICNYKFLKKKVQKIKPNILFHLAAQSIVSNSYLDPVKTYNSNVFGTLNVLDCLKKNTSIKSVVIVTTDKVYKVKNRDSYYNENDELGGFDPYSSSKVCSEIITKSYVDSFFNFSNLKNKVSTVRSGNVIGGGDYSKDRLVPDIIKCARNKQKLIIRNPDSVRPWQHVIEPLYGYLILAQKQYENKLLNSNRSWNFGPKKKNFLKVISVVNKLKKEINLNILIKKNKKLIETKILKLNSGKSQKFLNWEPKWNIAKTIKKVLEWESFNKKKKNIKETCENQIIEYLE